MPLFSPQAGRHRILAAYLIPLFRRLSDANATGVTRTASDPSMPFDMSPVTTANASGPVTVPVSAQRYVDTTLVGTVASDLTGAEQTAHTRVEGVGGSMDTLDDPQAQQFRDYDDDDYYSGDDGEGGDGAQPYDEAPGPDSTPVRCADALLCMREWMSMLL